MPNRIYEVKYLLVKSVLYPGAYNLKDEADVLTTDEYEHLRSALQHIRKDRVKHTRQPEHINFEGTPVDST